jgi:hypothetical protein
MARRTDTFDFPMEWAANTLEVHNMMRCREHGPCASGKAVSRRNHCHLCSFLILIDLLAHGCLSVLPAASAPDP